MIARFCENTNFTALLKTANYFSKKATLEMSDRVLNNLLYILCLQIDRSYAMSLKVFDVQSHCLVTENKARL